ncbi:RxLR effector protein [Phytophthora megakarya]|uniref:RxLR effector protein n=1 Tax=Phytophthora megakarya TaxID=4795 RepID=A0A225V5J9_9STRA|nr:RxLR effector protein [Phytophthora megakarya]
MRHYFLVCVPLLVNVVLIDAGSSSVGPKVLQSDCSKTVIHQATTQNEFSHTRLLRSNSASSIGCTEERTGETVFEKVNKYVQVEFKSKRIPDKLQKWLQDETPVDTVFKGLQLDINKAGQSLFDNPHFTAWIKYADTLSAKIPEMSAISSLTRRFGDDRLYNFIQRAKMNPSTQNLAKELETKQIQHWLAVRKDPDEVFRLFELQYQWRHILK